MCDVYVSVSYKVLEETYYSFSVTIQSWFRTAGMAANGNGTTANGREREKKKRWVLNTVSSPNQQSVRHSPHAVMEMMAK